MFLAFEFNEIAAEPANGSITLLQFFASELNCSLNQSLLPEYGNSLNIFTFLSFAECP